MFHDEPANRLVAFDARAQPHLIAQPIHEGRRVTVFRRTRSKSQTQRDVEIDRKQPLKVRPVQDWLLGPKRQQFGEAVERHRPAETFAEKCQIAVAAGCLVEFRIAERYAGRIAPLRRGPQTAAMDTGPDHAQHHGRGADAVDVLGHLFSPLQALNVLAPLCRGTMIISLDVIDTPTNRLQLKSLPAMHYLGGSKEDDGRSWWLPDCECLHQMLDKVGFRSVEIAGEHTCLVRRCWRTAHRAIYHAKK